MSHVYMMIGRVLRNFAVSMPIAITFLDYVGYVAKVEGTSMQPSLNPGHEKTSDYVFLNKWAVRNFDVYPGDIVALTCPKDPDQKIIKRIIAKEGETVKSANSWRYIYIPNGHCWVEGDHLAHSMDSNLFGPVSLGLVTAKASHIVWPPSRWRRLETDLPPGRHPIRYPEVAPWDEMKSSPLY